MVGLWIASIWMGVTLAGLLVPPFFPRFYRWLRDNTDDDLRYVGLTLWPIVLPIGLVIGAIAGPVTVLGALERHISSWSADRMVAKEKAAREKANRIRVAQEQKETAIPVVVPNEQCDYRHADCHTCGKPLV